MEVHDKFSKRQDKFTPLMNIPQAIALLAQFTKST
jgi:hypothetical protein